MDMFGFFSKLRKHTGFHREESDEEHTHVNSSGSHNPDDREDDGYLLVGQTHSERATVYGATFSPQGNVNSPPEYGQVASDLPTYSSVLSGECTIVSGPGSTFISGVEVSQLQRQDTVSSVSHKSAICDVPFQLHPRLAVHQLVDSIFSDVDLERHSFNWSKYSHDFMNEKLCLRDLNCDEEANIDGFMVSAQDSSSQLQDNTEVNLMQF